MRVIWFNRCFTTIYHTIIGYKEMFGESIKIIGTSTNPEHGWKEACDEFYMEHDGKGLEYVKWAANFCNEHNVDIFFVKANRVDIAKYRKEFDSILDHPVKLVLNSYESQKLVDNKAELYNKLKDNKAKIIVPRYECRVISDIDKDYLMNLMNKWGSLCYKFNTDEGAGSFRIVVDRKSKYRAAMYPKTSITLDEAIAELKEYSEVYNKTEIMFMEVLDEPEISIDCYNSKKGFVAVARYKDGRRGQVVTKIPDLEAQCKELQSMLNFEYPWNVQFRKGSDGRYNLLEINPRMSGGSYVGRLAGVWHCEYLIKDLLNLEYEIGTVQTMKVTKIENLIVLKG